MLVGLIAGVMQAMGIVSHAIDAKIYFDANLDHLYPFRWSDTSEPFLYPPVMAQILTLLHVIPWEVYETLSAFVLFAAVWWLAGRWSWLFLAGGVAGTLFPWLPYEFGSVIGYALNGNVQLLIAVVAVAGLRHPGFWSFPILTKVGAGVGVLWFLFRREWRPLLIAAATTTGITAASFVVAPHLWFEYVAFLLRNTDMPSPVPLFPVPFPIRATVAVMLLAWGAPRGHRWTVPIAVGLGIPALYLGGEIAICLGVLRLWRLGELRSTTGQAATRLAA